MHCAPIVTALRHLVRLYDLFIDVLVMDEDTACAIIALRCCRHIANLPRVLWTCRTWSFNGSVAYPARRPAVPEQLDRPAPGRGLTRGFMRNASIPCLRFLGIMAVAKPVQRMMGRSRAEAAGVRRPALRLSCRHGLIRNDRSKWCGVWRNVSGQRDYWYGPRLDAQFLQHPLADTDENGLFIIHKQNHPWQRGGFVLGWLCRHAWRAKADRLRCRALSWCTLGLIAPPDDGQSMHYCQCPLPVPCPSLVVKNGSRRG